MGFTRTMICLHVALKSVLSDLTSSICLIVHANKYVVTSLSVKQEVLQKQLNVFVTWSAEQANCQIQKAFHATFPMIITWFTLLSVSIVKTANTSHRYR